MQFFFFYLVSSVRTLTISFPNGSCVTYSYGFEILCPEFFHEFNQFHINEAKVVWIFAVCFRFIMH